MPTLAEVHVDGPLTNLSIAYMNEEFVAEQVAPPLPVDKETDLYFVYNKETFLRSSGLNAQGEPYSLRAAGAEAITDDWDLSTTPYVAKEYARKQLVPARLVRIADNAMQPDVDATLIETERLKLDNEVKTAYLAMNSTTYPTANKVTLTGGGAGTSWAQYASANSKPLSDIKTGKVQIRKSIMREPNAAVYTVDTAQTLADHPDIKDLTKYTHADGLSQSGLPKVLRGLETIEGATQMATSARGQTFASGNVWADESGNPAATIFYRSRDTGPRSIHAFRTFDAPDGATGVKGINIRRWWEDKLKGWMIEAAMTRAWVSIAIDGSNKTIGGYLLQGATA